MPLQGPCPLFLFFSALCVHCLILILVHLLCHWSLAPRSTTIPSPSLPSCCFGCCSTHLSPSSQFVLRLLPGKKPAFLCRFASSLQTRCMNRYYNWQLGHYEPKWEVSKECWAKSRRGTRINTDHRLSSKKFYGKGKDLGTIVRE